MRFVRRNRPYVKRGQQYLLIYIVYTVFCKKFKRKQDEGSASDLRSVFTMIVLQFTLLVTFMLISWYSTDIFFGPTEASNDGDLRMHA